MTCEGCGTDAELAECDRCERALCSRCRRASIDHADVLESVCVPCALDELVDQTCARVEIPPRHVVTPV